MRIDETECRRLFSAALGAGDIKHPHVLELVVSYLTTGVAASIDESTVSYNDMSQTEIDIDAILFSWRIPVQNRSWVVDAFNALISRYPSPQT